MIGDPKPDQERTLQSEEVTDANVKKIQTQAQRLISSDDNQVTFVNNKDWLLKVNLVSFLRDIGKHFTVNELIKKDAITKRLESEVGLSYTEFAYPLLQGYDYLELYKTMGCDVQVGGSDQWGNIVSGVDLIRRKEQHTVHAITVPLVVDKATGKKFGKSEGNAVWLDTEKTSPFAFYQFWLNVSDDSVIDYLKLFTFLSLDTIAEIEKDFNSNPGSRTAQKKLAYEVTAFVHGEGVAESVTKVSGILFGDGSLETLTESEIKILQTSVPSYEVQEGASVVDVLVESELATSKREARTFIESDAVVLFGSKVTSIDAAIESQYFVNSFAFLRRGRNKVALLILK